MFCVLSASVFQSLLCLRTTIPATYKLQNTVLYVILHRHKHLFASIQNIRLNIKTQTWYQLIMYGRSLVVWGPQFGTTALRYCWILKIKKKPEKLITNYGIYFMNIKANVQIFESFSWNWLLSNISGCRLRLSREDLWFKSSRSRPSLYWG